MFSNDPALISISDISGWDTSKVQFMDNMFNGDKNLTTVKGLSHLNAHNAKQDDMFKDSALVPKGFDFNNTGLRDYLNNHKNDSSIDASDFRTSHVTDMSGLFQNIGRSSLDLSDWNTGNVEKMGWMFANTRTDITSAPLKEIKGLENWDVRNVQDFSHMFHSGGVPVEIGSFVPTGSLTKLDLSNWKLDHVTLTDHMFSLCKKLTFDSDAMANMANWNTSSDESMSGMFQEMNKVKDLSFISNWDISSVKDMSYLFQNDYALTHVGDLSHWNTNKVGTVSDLNYSFAMMFTGCEPFQEIKGIEHWDFTHAHSMRGMFMDTPVLNRVDLSQATKSVNLQIAASMFDGSGATYINLSGWDLSKLHLFDDTGAIVNTPSAISAFMVLASWATLRGGQDMFANLRRPVEIVLTGATLPTGENVLQVSDSRGNQPIVVFSDATALSALNGQHWTDGNGNDVTGRQNSDYLTINNGSTTTTVPMDFVYKDQAALTAALAQKLSPFGNVVKTSTRVDGQDIDPASLIALQDVTGIYGPKSNPGPTEPTIPVQPTKPAKPSKPAKPTEPAKKHTNKPAAPKKGKGYNYNSSVHGETIKGRNKANGTTNNVMPHAENTARPKGVAAPDGETLHGYTINTKGQILNAKGQAVGYVDKSGHMHLPQISEKSTASLAWLGLGIASLAAIIGLAADRKRR